MRNAILTMFTILSGRWKRKNSYLFSKKVTPKTFKSLLGFLLVTFLSPERKVITVLAVVVLLFLPSLAQARQPDLTIFFSSDTRGMLRRCGCSQGQMGGLSARATYIKANSPKGRTLVLDAGDILFNDPKQKESWADFYEIKARTMLKAMEVSGYAAAVPGEYDFAFGAEFLKDAARDTDFPFVAANVSYRCVPVFRPYVIKKVGNLKVAIIGVLDDAFPYKNFQAYDGLTVSDAREAAERSIRTIGDKADLRIVLAHLSITDPAKFAESVSGADIVVQGHSDEILDAPVKAGGALLVKGFYKGKQIGRLDIWLSGRKGGKRVADYKYQVVQLDESIPFNPQVEGLLAKYREKLKEKNFSFNAPDPEGKGSFVGARACRGCHEKSFSNWSATKHAHAFSDLVKTGDQYDPECLPCHTTGYGFASGYPAGGRRMKNTACEDCHGRGSLHAAGKAGMDKVVKEGVCASCHDEYDSPNFDFEKYKAMGGAHRGGE